MYFVLKVHPKGYLNSDNLLPPVVVNDHKLSREEWEEKIAKFHAKHNGMSRAEAMMEYLKVLYCIYVFVALQKRESYNTQNYCLGGTGP